MANPVKQFRLDEQGRLTTALTARQGDLAAVETELGAKREVVKQKAKDLAELQAEESRLRQALGAAPMPANADALADLLEANLKAQRTTSAAVADATDAVSLAERRRARAASALDLARSQLAQATADLEVATADDDQAQRWRAALADAAMADLVTGAGSPATNALRASAASRLASLVGGADLLTLFERRFEVARADSDERVEAASRAERRLAALHTAQDPVGGAVAAAAATLGVRRQAVRAAAETTAQVMERSLLALGAAGSLPNLNLEDQTKINQAATRANTVQPTESTSAVDLELEVLTKRDGVRTAWVTFDTAALAEEAADADFDRDDPNELQTERGDLEQAEQDLADAESDLAGTPKGRLDAWEVAIPPAVLAAVVEYLWAKDAVADIAALNLAALVTALNNAETDYVDALRDQQEAVAWRAALGTTVAERLDAVEALSPSLEAREAALVRGDR